MIKFAGFLAVIIICGLSVAVAGTGTNPECGKTEAKEPKKGREIKKKPKAQEKDKKKSAKYKEKRKLSKIERAPKNRDITAPR